jgi:hypothetical protein
VSPPASCAELGIDSFELVRRPARPGTIPRARPEPPGPGFCGTGATASARCAPDRSLGSYRSGAERRCLLGTSLTKDWMKRTFGALLRNLALVRFARNYALLRRLSGRS